MSKEPSDLQIRKSEPVLARPIPRPREGRAAEHHSSLNQADVLYALFKHKKKILFATIAGLIVAALVYVFYPAVYESDAKLLVRYLVERSTVDTVETARNPGGYTPATDAVIRAESEILSSWDLAVQTAEAIGPKRLLPDFKGTPSKEDAAAVIASGLSLSTTKGSNIIFVAYKNHNPELTTVVLNELVNRYFNKHLEVHRSAGAFDFVAQQTDQVRARLNQTEDALKDVKQKAGILSLQDSTSALVDESQKVEDQLHSAEADIAEHQAQLRQLRTSTGGVTVMAGEENASQGSDSSVSDQENGEEKAAGSKPAASPKPTVPPELVQKYEGLSAGLDKLKKERTDLFAHYTTRSERVKANQAGIDQTAKQMRQLEKQYPDVSTKAETSSRGSRELTPASEATRVAGLRARRGALAARLADVKKRIQQLEEVSPEIIDLERQKQLQETNYKYFQETLEKARVDEALDPSKIPNISAVQRPSPPRLDTGKRNKIVMGLAVSGLGLAIGLVLLKELMFDRSIRRPSEIEKFVGAGSLMAIPYHYKLNGASKVKRNGKGMAIIPAVASQKIAPWDKGHFIRAYAEAIRDRIGLYFELHNLTHKPKLVGVAAISEGGGASTLATGLAAALSETGDGKVLLVDVNLGPDQVHPFFRGKPAYSLNTALQPDGQIAAAAENLYLAVVGSPNAGPAQLGLKKFFDLMPNLKASDFDYIIFDMPPLDQTSPTWGMAPFMDKMLLIVEAEKNSRDTVKRAHRKLVSDRDNVSLVVNKVHSYAPKRLELEA